MDAWLGSCVSVVMVAIPETDPDRLSSQRACHWKLGKQRGMTASRPGNSNHTFRCGGKVAPNKKKH